MKQLALLGASGHGKVLADAALALGWETVVFFDDAWPGVSANGRWPVVGDSAALIERLPEFDGVVVAIGNCEIRWRRHVQLRELGARLATLVHPQACVSRFARIGVGSVVMAGAVVNVDSVVGEACIINTGATVDHDCLLGDGVHIGPGASLSGNVSVGMGSWVGVGATVKQGVTIGIGATAGAGAVVVKPVQDHAVVVGVPAGPFRAQA